MSNTKRHVYFVGSQSEVAHHAAPLLANLDASSDVQIIACEEVVTTAKRGDIAIFFSEHFDRFRQAILELKDNGVPTIYLVDGILEWRNAWENSPQEPACPFTMRPVLCDKVAVIGHSQARVLSSWNNGGKIEVVGIPRLDTWTERWRSGQKSSEDQSSTFRVLVTTAKTPGFTPDQIETTARSLADLKSWFDANDSINGRSIEVTWRLTAGLEDHIGVSNELSDLSGTELQDSIAHCDAMITTPSTAMLEGMLQHKPVAILNYHHCPTYVPAAWNIHGSRAIDAVLRQLADPAEECLHYQQSILADTLQVAETASERLIQLIHSMLASATAQTEPGKSLEFGTNLLPAADFDPKLNSRVTKLNSAEVFSNFNEFAVDTKADALRAQLAHARREIDHLHRIQKGLKAELEEAHSIFEQIQQHPIAGPVVRIRERFLQFVSRNTKES